MTFDLSEVSGPHAGARVLTAGVEVATARAAVVMCHGRGAHADDMLGLAALLDSPGVAFVAPQASGYTWYPRPFIAPLRENEPYLSSALAMIGALVAQIERAGVPRARQIVMGFSQGGCLALEFAGRNAARYGGAAGLSSGLIGPPGIAWNFGGSLAGTPVFLGCSDRDPHIPRERVEESALELTRIGGEVDMRIYPGLGHTINDDEMERVRGLIQGATA